MLTTRPLLVQAVTVRMEIVKEAGAVTPPTRRWPRRNYMSASLMIVTEQRKCSYRRRLVQWAVAPEAVRRELTTVMIVKLAEAAAATPTRPRPDEARQYNTRMWQTDGQTPHDGIGRARHSLARQKLVAIQYSKLEEMFLRQEMPNAENLNLQTAKVKVGKSRYIADILFLLSGGSVFTPGWNVSKYCNRVHSYTVARVARL